MPDADFRRLMKDRVDAFKRGSNSLRIANVRANKLGRRIKEFGRAVSMHLGYQQIQHADAMPTLNQRIGQMRADKTCPAGN